MIDSFGRPDVACSGRLGADATQEKAGDAAAVACSAAGHPELAPACAEYASVMVGSLEDLGSSFMSIFQGDKTIPCEDALGPILCSQASPDQWSYKVKDPFAIMAAFDAWVAKVYPDGNFYVNIPTAHGPEPFPVSLDDTGLPLPAGTLRAAMLSRFYQAAAEHSPKPTGPTPAEIDAEQEACLAWHGMIWDDVKGACLCPPPGVLNINPKNGDTSCDPPPGGANDPRDHGPSVGSDQTPEGHGFAVKALGALLAAGAVYSGVQFARGKPIVPPALQASLKRRLGR